MTKIVILGAGYAGLLTAKELGKILDSKVCSIDLVNKNSYHYYTTELHKIAGGRFTDVSKVSISLKEVLPSNVNLIVDEVNGIDIKNKNVTLNKNKSLEYDILVIALGYEIEYFGLESIKENALYIKDVISSQEIYTSVEENIKQYTKTKDESYLSFGIGGAGATGVELAGELAIQLKKLAKINNIAFDKFKLYCIEGLSAAMPGFDPKVSDYIRDFLESEGVILKFNSKIISFDKNHLIIEKDNKKEEIPMKLFVWSAGIRGHSLVEKSGLENIKARVPVLSTLQAKEDKNIFVIGDSSVVFDENNKPYPPTAQIATQQASVCAENIKAILELKELKLFVPNIKGMAISISPKTSVGLVGSFVLTGFAANVLKKITEKLHTYRINS